MFDVALVIARTVTVLFMLSVVVYRRRTIGSPWESGITIQLALQCAGLWLCGPLASYLLGPSLHAVTGRYHTEDLVGAICYVLATAVIAANMFQRVAHDDSEAQKIVNCCLQPIVTLIPLVLVVCYWLSDVCRQPAAATTQLFDLDPDLPLSVLWCTMYGTAGAHLLLAAWACGIIADDPEQRHIAREWQVALYCGVFACITGTINTFMGQLWDDLAWIGIIGIGAGTAWICARSWYRQMRSAKMLLKYTRTKRRERRADTLESHRARILRSAERILDQALDQDNANRDDDDGPRPLQGSATS